MARKWSLSKRKLDYRAYRVYAYAAEETSKAKKLNGNKLNDENVRIFMQHMFWPINCLLLVATRLVYVYAVHKMRSTILRSLS